MSDTIEVHPILDPIAFACALVLAPIAFTAMTFWLMFIPVAAVFFGALPYLIFGTPVFLWMATRYPLSFGSYALGGLAAHTAFILCLALMQAAGDSRFDGLPGFMAPWGVPFSLGWGGTFAWIYRGFYRSPLR